MKIDYDYQNFLQKVSDMLQKFYTAKGGLVREADITSEFVTLVVIIPASKTSPLISVEITIRKRSEVWIYDLSTEQEASEEIRLELRNALNAFDSKIFSTAA